MSDGAPRLASLSVVGGAFHDKRVDLAGVDEITIGSDSGCSLVVDLPGVSPLHAKIWVDLEGAKVYDTRSPSGVFVNMDRVQGERPLREGDTLWLGPPEEPGSILLQCRFERPPAARSDSEPLTLEPMGLDPSAHLPEVAVAVEPVALSADAFQDMTPSPAAASAPPGGSDFVVAGLPAQWPETVAPPRGTSPAATLPVAPLPPAAPAPPVAPVPLAGPVPPAAPAPTITPAPPPPAPPSAAAAPPPPTAQEDSFFVGEVGEVPAPVAPKEELFFIDGFEGPSEPPPPPAPKPPPPAPPPPSAAPAPVDEFFFDEPERPATPAFASFSEEAPFEVKPLTDVGVPKLSDFGTPATEWPAISPPTSSPEPPPPPPAVAPVPVAAEPAPPAAEPTPAPAPRPAAAAPAPARRGEGAPAARRPAPAGARAPAAARPTTRSVPRGGGGPSPMVRYAAFGVGGLVVVGLLGFLAMRFLGGSVRLDSVEPGRGRSGTTVTLTGSGFDADPKGNTVLFGDTPAAVVTASATRIEVAVPEVPVTGEEAKIAIRVRVGGGASKPLDFSVLGGPTIHGISPDVAMPGEEVVLAGSGWGLGAAVRFGVVPAEVMEVRDTSIRARVPPMPGGPGTAAPAVVTMGASSSNELPFFIGSIPLVLTIDPAIASPGDVVTISGRGFQRETMRNAVLVGGAFALVVSASDSELKVAVPTLAPGEPARPVEVRVAGFATVGRGVLTIPPLPESVELHLVPQVFDAVAGRSYAVLATDVGPAFVLAGSGGRSAAERAVEAQHRFDEAVTAIKATRGLNFEARALETSPAIGLPGRPEVVLEVTEEDARAYEEDWTGLKGRGGPVSRSRLARWWEAVARDLVLLLVRGERPQFAAELAPEGRVFLDVYQAAQKTGRFGVTREVVTALRPPQREALRLVALRVPASVTGPAMAALPVVPGTGGGAAATPAPASTALRLEGAWIGSEDEAGEKRYLTATFRSGSGTVAYEGMVTLTVPFLTLETPQRGMVRWSLQFKGGIRYYTGKWDGQAIRGNFSRDAAGTSPIGTFELRPR